MDVFLTKKFATLLVDYFKDDISVAQANSLNVYLQPYYPCFDYQDPFLKENNFSVVVHFLPVTEWVYKINNNLYICLKVAAQQNTDIYLLVPLTDLQIVAQRITVDTFIKSIANEWSDYLNNYLEPVLSRTWTSCDTETPLVGPYYIYTETFTNLFALLSAIKNQRAYTNGAVLASTYCRALQWISLTSDFLIASLDAERVWEVVKHKEFNCILQNRLSVRIWKSYADPVTQIPEPYSTLAILDNFELDLEEFRDIFHLEPPQPASIEEDKCEEPEAKRIKLDNDFEADTFANKENAGVGGKPKRFNAKKYELLFGIPDNGGIFERLVDNLSKEMGLKLKEPDFTKSVGMVLLLVFDIIKSKSIVTSGNLSQFREVLADLFTSMGIKADFENAMVSIKKNNHIMSINLIHGHQLLFGKQRKDSNLIQHSFIGWISEAENISFRHSRAGSKDKYDNLYLKGTHKEDADKFLVFRKYLYVTIENKSVGI